MPRFGEHLESRTAPPAETDESQPCFAPPLFSLLGGNRWHALLSSRIGQSLKDLVDIIEEELVHLEEVSDA